MDALENHAGATGFLMGMPNDWAARRFGMNDVLPPMFKEPSIF